MKLDGKTALITGRASGIGRATVMEFAGCGATVICADVDEKKGAEVAKESSGTKLKVDNAAVDLSGASPRCSSAIRASGLIVIASTDAALAH